MLLEKRLSDLALADDEMNKMYQKWSVLKCDVIKKLNTVSIYFPHFSLHNESHSKTISVQIGRLLGNDRINKLSFTDLFMMLLCFYMHDIGMAVQYEEINNKFQSVEFKEYMYKLTNDTKSDLYQVAKRLSSIDSRLASLEYDKSIDVYNDVILIIEDMYRKNHAQRSADEIKLNFNLYKDIGVRFVQILAEMCEIHQKSVSSIMNLPYKSNGLFDDYMHPRFIASMLCLGDLLDLDTDRFDYTMLQAVSPLPHNSRLHLEKHKSIKQFLIEPEGIEIISDSKDIEVYRVMREWVDWIEEMCNFLAINWSQIAPENFGMAPHIKRCELLLNNNKRWLQFADMKFKISSKRALDILKGSRIYKNKFVCLREIIQNAIDATILRIFKEKIFENSEEKVLEELKSLNWEGYKIEGDIFLNNNFEVEIKIRDKGIGISEEDIKKIAAISNERVEKKKNIINKMPVWIRPSGAFGIGLQSIFLLTDKFEIITKTNEEKAKKIIFESAQELNGYITVEDYEETFLEGTQVRFIIDSKKLELEDLSCAEYFYKTERKEIFILQKINELYSNMLQGVPPIYSMEKQESDYVPANISIMNPIDKSKVEMINFSTIFTKNMDYINIGKSDVQCCEFIYKRCCQIYFNFGLKNNEEHKYGDVRKVSQTKYGNTVFYRNVFVSYKIIEQFFTSNRALYPYLDFRINLLTEDADLVLELNRNAIKESYENKFIQTIKESTKEVIKHIIDKLDNEKSDCDVGDWIFIFYQFSRQIEYKHDIIKTKFKAVLDNIYFNNYYSWTTKKENEYSFNELTDNHLYLVLEEICIEDIKQGEYPKLDDKEKYCVCLEQEKNTKSDVHILNHRVEKMFVARLGEKLIKVLEVIPFECSNNSIICHKDDLFILEDIINMFMEESRCMNSIKEFEILITPLKSKSGLVKYGWIECESMIEMPFERDMIIEMKQEMLNSGYIQNANDKYFHKVISSDKFAKNIEYIQKYNNEDRCMIKEKYQELINKVLELLSDYNYIKHNFKCIEWYKEHKNFKRGKYEMIEHNNYVALSY